MSATGRVAVRDERGSAPALELTLVAVPLLAVAMFVVFAGRMVVVNGTLEGTAHYAARTAARARAAGDAHAAAVEAVEAELVAAELPCVSSQVGVDTGDFGPGGTVRVSVQCQLRLSDLGPLPLPGTSMIEVTAVAAVDRYRGTA